MTSRRRHIGLEAKLHAALRQLGFEPHEVELDHDPALCLRPVDPATGDTIPPASDPRYLVWRPKAEHALKTHGPGGERRITTAGSDRHTAAKIDRLAERQAEFERQRAALLKPERQERPRSKWPSRPFPSRRPG